MTHFDERPQEPKGDPFEDIDTQPEKTDLFCIKTPPPFVKRPMRERRGGGPVTVVGVRRSGLAAQEGKRSGLRSHHD